VVWARQYVECAERDYALMVDGMLAESEQLEGLARLLSRQLLDTPEWPEEAAVSVVARVEEVLEQGVELRRQREDQVQALQKELREEKLESEALRRRLEDALQELAAVRGEVATAGAGSFAGAVGDTMGKTRSVVPVLQHVTMTGSCEGEENADGAWSARLVQAELARAHEARRVELVEARCALIESRCRQLVQRLEAELAHCRGVSGTAAMCDSGNGSGWGSGRGGGAAASSLRDPARCITATMPSSCGDLLSQPLEQDGQALWEEVLALRRQLDDEREMHKQHITAYHNYLPDLANACGLPLSKGALNLEKNASVLSPGGGPEVLQRSFRVEGAAADGANGASHPRAGDGIGSSAQGQQRGAQSNRSAGQQEPRRVMQGAFVQSDDEDYAGEGYLEQSTGGGRFEKVFFELSRDRFRVSKDRGTAEPLYTCALADLERPAEHASSSARCFRVWQRGQDGPLTFRCVSERRATQWVEAINCACRRSTQKSNVRAMPSQHVPAGGSGSAW